MATKRRDKGSGSVYRDDRGRWRATLELGWVMAGRDEHGDPQYRRQRKVLTGKTKADVVKKLREARKQLDQTGTLATNVPTLGKWLDSWLADIASQRVRPRTLESHRSYVEQHIVPHLGRHRLDKLTPAHILDWHKTLRAKPKARGNGTLEESAVLRAHAVLSRALDDAVRINGLPRNPAKMVDRPSKGAPTVGYLDAGQAATLLRHVASDPLGSRWAFALLTGQRQGECLGLRWSHLDLERGIADVAWQLQRLGYRHGCTNRCGRKFAGDCPERELDVAGDHEYVVLEGALCLTRPKSAMHIVPLIPSLVAWLRRRRDENETGQHDLVWTRGGGRPIDLRQDYQAWVDLLAECGLPRVKLHSARHTCASILLSLGVQESTIMQMVGHSTVAAARSYQHLDTSAAQAAALRLGQALELEPGA